MKKFQRTKRVPKRIVIRYSTGSGALPGSGCTMDMSPGGLFMSVGMPLAPGTHVLGRLQLPDGKQAEVHGIVAWARQVPRALNAIARGGMGLRLVWAESAYYEFVGKLGL